MSINTTAINSIIDFVAPSIIERVVESSFLHLFQSSVQQAPQTIPEAPSSSSLTGRTIIRIIDDVSGGGVSAVVNDTINKASPVIDQFIEKEAPEWAECFVESLFATALPDGATTDERSLVSCFFSWLFDLLCEKIKSLFEPSPEEIKNIQLLASQLDEYDLHALYSKTLKEKLETIKQALKSEVCIAEFELRVALENGETVENWLEAKTAQLESMDNKIDAAKKYLAFIKACFKACPESREDIRKLLTLASKSLQSEIANSVPRPTDPTRLNEIRKRMLTLNINSARELFNQRVEAHFIYQLQLIHHHQ